MGADAPMLVGADMPASMGDDSLVVMRVDSPRSRERRRFRPPDLAAVTDPCVGEAANPSVGASVERQSFRSPYADVAEDPSVGELEDPSEMERQVRDQLYGPGFRRR